jgi:hypothetical protein
MPIKFGRGLKPPDGIERAGGAEREASAEAVMPRMASGNVNDRNWLAHRDVELLCALSALQILYGRPEEAAAYLMMVREAAPENTDALRLLASSFIKLPRGQEASCLIDELEARQSKPNRISILLRAIVEFKLLRKNNALDAFRALGKIGRPGHG